MSSVQGKDLHHYQVALFLRSEKSKNFELNSSHRLILRVIADYCDMKLGYCCLKQIDLARECGLKERQLRDCLKLLVNEDLIFRVFRGKLSIYRIGEVITGISNE